MDDKNREFSEDELRGAINSREAEARRILEDESKVYKLLENAKKIIKKIKNVPVIGGFVDDLVTLFELIGDYAKGNYTKIPFRIIVSAVAGVIYLVSPIDIIPDFIPIVGWLDDAAVLTLLLNSGLALEIRKYKKWKLLLKKDVFINELQCDIKEIIEGKQLVAIFLTDDNALKLLISNSSNNEMIPIEVYLELLDFDYALLKSMCDGLNMKIMDALDEIRLRFVKEDMDNFIQNFKVCRESDFTAFDEIFDIITEED